MSSVRCASLLPLVSVAVCLIRTGAYPGYKLRPLYLVRVVESTGRARQTGSGPGPKRAQEAVGSLRPSFGKQSPNSCQGLSETNTERARIRKDRPQDQGGATYGP